MEDERSTIKDERWKMKESRKRQRWKMKQKDERYTCCTFCYIMTLFLKLNLTSISSLTYIRFRFNRLSRFRVADYFPKIYEVYENRIYLSTLANPSCPAPYPHQWKYENCPYNVFAAINLNFLCVLLPHPARHCVLWVLLSPEIDHQVPILLSVRA